MAEKRFHCLGCEMTDAENPDPSARVTTSSGDFAQLTFEAVPLLCDLLNDWDQRQKESIGRACRVKRAHSSGRWFLCDESGTAIPGTESFSSRQNALVYAVAQRYRVNHVDGEPERTCGDRPEGVSGVSGTRHTPGAPEHQRDCEVRWDEREQGWRVHWPVGAPSRAQPLATCLAHARERNHRVTNNPKEVVLYRSRSGAYSFTPNPSSDDIWIESSIRNHVKFKGWRILREEPEKPNHAVLTNSGTLSGPMTLDEAKKHCGDSPIVKLVPVWWMGSPLP